MVAWFWLLLLAFVAFVGGLVTGWSLLEHLAYAVVALELLALTAGLVSGRKVSLKSSTDRRRIQAGDVVRETTLLEGKGKWPAFWLELDTGGERVAVNLHENERTVTRERVYDQRGFHLVGTAELRIRDPFGLIDLKRTESEGVAITVLPRTIRCVAAAQFVAGMRRARSIGAHLAGDFGVGDLREYRPGDPLGRIHWRSTARARRPMVIEPEAGGESVIWLLVDAGGDGSEESMGIATWIIEQLGRSRVSVGLIVAGEEVEIVDPATSARSHDELLDALAFAQISARSRVGPLLKASGQCRPEDTFALITGNFEPQAIELARQRNLHIIRPDAAEKRAA